MAPSTPKLSSLPLEIRQNIYYFLFDSKYFRDWTKPPELQAQCTGSLNILQASHAIREEASEVLYRESTFCFTIPSNPEHYHPSKSPISNRIINIEVRQDSPHRSQSFSKYRKPSPVYRRSLNSIISHVSGSQTKRGKFKVTCDPIQLLPFTGSEASEASGALDDDILTSLSKLTGFRAVVICLQTRGQIPYRARPLRLARPNMPWRDVVQNLGEKGEESMLCYEGIMAKLMYWLEPSLGEGTLRDLEAYNVVYARYAVFHPRSWEQDRSLMERGR